MEASAIIAILSVAFAGTVSLIHAVFTNMSLSRCTDIACCCFSCKRDVLHGEELRHMADAAAPHHGGGP